MVRKIKVNIKKPVETIEKELDDPKIIKENHTETEEVHEDEITNIPTCMRCYIKNEKDIQKLNNMILRFNVGKTDLDIQRIGYKMVDGKMAEIDIAALHAENYSVNKAEYEVINRYLATFMKQNDIGFKFIDFGDSHKNSADCYLTIDGLSTIAEFITIEKGSVSDDLFSYLRNKLNLPVDIVSISIPISDKSGIFVTYHTEWVRKEEKVKEDKKEENTFNQVSESDAIEVSVYVYTEEASECVDLVLYKFNNAIGRSMYDYTEKDKNGYYRVIRMSVILNDLGNSLVNSLDKIDNIVVIKT